MEKNAYAYQLTETILSGDKNATVIEIENYKDIFSRGGQNFQEQKKSTKLILAVKKDNYLYEGSGTAPDFGFTNFYYNTPALNCVYNCDYCYLQGMYSSANIVLFVNLEDFFKEAEKKLSEQTYLCISYDTDLLAMESFFPAASLWIEFAANHPSLCLDPVIAIPDWGRIYSELIAEIFKKISPEKIRDISVGTFRMNTDYLKKITKNRNDSDLLFYPFVPVGKIKTYPQELEKDIKETMSNKLLKYIPKEKIFFQSSWE